MTKLSPLSVPYRVLQRGGSIAFALVFALASGASSIPFLGLAGPIAFVVLAALVILLVVAYEFAYYRRYEYELTTDTFDIQSGVVARRNREIPLRRIQNVDISRNVVQRVLGVAAVDFETAGGSETEAAIRYVSFEEAKRLQAEIGRLKRGAEDPAERETEPASELFALSDRELALVGALSFDFRVPGILFVLGSGSFPILSTAVPDGGGLPVVLGGLLFLFVVVVLFSWAAGAVLAIVNYYGFRLLRTGDELQYERGLLQRYDGSIPLDKVQTLTIEDNPLKRYFDYATLYIETAGYAPGQGGGGRGSQAAVPLATRPRVERLANDIESFGAPEFQRPPRRVRRRYAARYLIALGVVTSLLFGVDSLLPQSLPWFGTAVLLPLVPLAAHFKWKHRGYWLGDDHVVTRNGVLKRQIKVVPYYRIQTVIDSRTIFQRRWKLATVTVDTAGSLSLTQQDAAAVDVDAETAASLRGTLGERLRSALAARRSAGRPGPGPRGTEPATLSEGNTHGPVNGAPEDESAETDVSVDDGPGTDPPEGDGAEGERGDRDASRDDSPSDESDRETDRGSNAEAGGEAESTETRDAG